MKEASIQQKSLNVEPTALSEEAAGRITKKYANKINRMIFENHGMYGVVDIAAPWLSGKGELPPGVNEFSICIIMDIGLFTNFIGSFTNLIAQDIEGLRYFDPITQRKQLYSGVYAFYHGVPIIVSRKLKHCF